MELECDLKPQHKIATPRKQNCAHTDALESILTSLNTTFLQNLREHSNSIETVNNL